MEPKSSVSDRIRSHRVVSLFLLAGGLAAAVLALDGLRGVLWPEDEADLATLTVEVGKVTTLSEYENSASASGLLSLGAVSDEPVTAAPWTIEPAIVRVHSGQVLGVGRVSEHLSRRLPVASTPTPEAPETIPPTPNTLPPGYLEEVWDHPKLKNYPDLPALGSTAEGYTKAAAVSEDGELRPVEETARIVADQMSNVQPAPIAPFTAADVGRLNVRLEPTVSAESTGSVTGGEALSVVCVTSGESVSRPDGDGATAGWYRIDAPVGGYVSAAFVLRSDDSEDPLPCEGPGKDTPETKAGFTAADVGRLNVRLEPTVSAESTGSVTGGEALSVLCVTSGESVSRPDGVGATADWYRIDAPVDGYVSAAFVLQFANAQYPPSCGTAGGFSVADVDRLNVREEPSLDTSPRVGLPRGEAVSVVCVTTGESISPPDGDGATADWYRIDAPVDGYVSAAFVVASPGTTRPPRCDDSAPDGPATKPLQRVGDLWGREVNVRVTLEGFKNEKVYVDWEMDSTVKEAVGKTGRFVLTPSTNRDAATIPLWFPILVEPTTYIVDIRLRDAQETAARPYDRKTVKISAEEGA